MKRKSIVLALLLVFALGSSSVAAAGTAVEPSKQLLALIRIADATIAAAVRVAEAGGQVAEDLYNRGLLSYAQAEAIMTQLADQLKHVETMALKPVLKRAEQEGVELEFSYFDVEIGWIIVEVDPILVAGNAG
ncbi:MAG: hypothetical protein ACOX18_03935 [Bacillota bacterium]